MSNEIHKSLLNLFWMLYPNEPLPATEEDIIEKIQEAIRNRDKYNRDKYNKRLDNIEEK